MVATDRTVERMKRKKPVIPQNQRKAIVEALKPVDEVILGFENMSFESTIDKIRPDIIALGYDQEDVEKAVKKVIIEKGLKIRVVIIRRFVFSDLNSSSNIKKKILKEMK